MALPDCLTCGDTCQDDVPGWTFEPVTKSCLQIKKEMPVIFLLRRILGVPQDRLESLLESIGNPSDWGIKLCPLCDRIFSEAMFLYERLMKLHNEFDQVSKQLRGRMETSFGVTPSPDQDELQNNIDSTKGRKRVKAGLGSKLREERERCTDLRSSLIHEVPIDCDAQGPSILSDVNLLDKLDISLHQNGILPLLKVKKELNEDLSCSSPRQMSEDLPQSPPVMNLALQTATAEENDNELEATLEDDHHGDSDYLPDEDRSNDDYDNSSETGEETGLVQEKMKQVTSIQDEIEEGEIVRTTAYNSPQPVRLSIGYQCPLCTRRSISKMLCHGHIMRAHFGKTKPYDCHLCRGNFRLDAQLRKHLDDDHNGVASPLDDSDSQAGDSDDAPNTKKSRELLECDLCPKDRSYKAKFKSQVLLDVHKQRAHDGAKIGKKTIYKCKVCNLTFRIPSLFRQHMYRHSRNEKQKEEAAKLYCHQCNRTFKTIRFLNKHLETKAHAEPDQYPFQCELCPKGFYLKQSLNDHHAHEHHQELNIEPYKCSHCGQLLSSRKALDNHVRIIHTKETLFRCEPCNLGFMYIKSYDRHIAIVHTKSKPLLCSFCPKQFANPSHLQTHLRVHTGEKPYKCGQCGKQYSDRPTYRRHLETHGDQVYTCTICNNREFKVWHTYRTHMKTHNQNVSKKKDADQTNEVVATS